MLWLAGYCTPEISITEQRMRCDVGFYSEFGFSFRLRASTVPHIHATQDVQKAAGKLPKDTETCIVEGGNHRGFASYTLQPLDWEVR